jgi:hypothetical protein
MFALRLGVAKNCADHLESPIGRCELDPYPVPRGPGRKERHFFMSKRTNAVMASAVILTGALCGAVVAATPQVANAATESCTNTETHHVTKRLRTVGRAEWRRCTDGANTRVDGWVAHVRGGDCIVVDARWSDGYSESKTACNKATEYFNMGWGRGTVRVTMRVANN